MKLSIITVVVTIINVSSCSATLISFISKLYESNVKTFWNKLHLKKMYAGAPVFDYNDELYNNVIDNNNELSYLNTNHHDYEIFQYEDYDENLTEESDDVFTTLSKFESDREFHEKSKPDGILNTILKFFGFQTPVLNTKNFSTPLYSSNQTSGLDVRLKSSYLTNLLMDAMESQFKLIYPGTLWCGGGTQAKSYDSYGLFRKTDRCCKKHDTCPKYIGAGKTWKSLENVGIFTRSHCDCDRAFYSCLKKINSFISNKIGVTYFNLLRPQCFRREYPVISCLEFRRDNRCFSYIIDNSKKKKWQWFDNKMY